MEDLIKRICLTIPDEVPLLRGTIREISEGEHLDYHRGCKVMTIDGECAGHLLIMKFPIEWLIRYMGRIAADIFVAAGDAKCGINRCAEREPDQVSNFFDHVLKKQCGFIDPEFGLDMMRYYLLVKGETSRDFGGAA